MDGGEFASKFSLNFTVYNLRGEEVSLTQREKTENLRISNCGAFRATANEFRLAEMAQYLLWMRDEFWGNLGFERSCGEKTITISALKRVPIVGIPADQAALFWRGLQCRGEECAAAVRNRDTEVAIGGIRTGDLPPQARQEIRHRRTALA
jgi:hypothetical protein